MVGWRNHLRRHRLGARRGYGGLVEVSSKDHLLFAGTVDAGAMAGRAGTLLLDPKNITTADAASYPRFELSDPAPAASTADGTGGRVAVGLTDPSQFTYALAPSQSVTLTPDRLTAVLNAGTAVTLQASSDITVNSAITANNPSGNGGALTLQAGRSILINADITTDNGNLTLIGNDLLANGVVDAQCDAGNAVITMAGGTQINAGTVTIELRTGVGKTNAATGTITLDAVTAASLTALNQGLTAGSGIALNGGALTLSDGGTALVLAADTGIFDNGNSATIDVGSGRYLIYSADEATTIPGGQTPGVTNGKPMRPMRRVR